MKKPVAASWFEFEPGVHQGDDGEDGGGQAAGPHKAPPSGVEAQPLQRDEDVAAVLQQVQQQRRVAAQHGRHQPHPPAQLGGAGGGRLGSKRALLALHQEMQLVHVSGQVEDEDKQVVPAQGDTTVTAGGS